MRFSKATIPRLLVTGFSVLAMSEAFAQSSAGSRPRTSRETGAVSTSLRPQLRAANRSFTSQAAQSLIHGFGGRIDSSTKRAYLTGSVPKECARHFKVTADQRLDSEGRLTFSIIDLTKQGIDCLDRNRGLCADTSRCRTFEQLSNDPNTRNQYQAVVGFNASARPRVIGLRTFGASDRAEHGMSPNPDETVQMEAVARCEGCELPSTGLETVRLQATGLQAIAQAAMEQNAGVAATPNSVAEPTAAAMSYEEPAIPFVEYTQEPQPPDEWERAEAGRSLRAQIASARSDRSGARGERLDRVRLMNKLLHMGQGVAGMVDMQRMQGQMGMGMGGFGGLPGYNGYADFALNLPPVAPAPSSGSSYFNGAPSPVFTPTTPLGVLPSSQYTPLTTSATDWWRSDPQAGGGSGVPSTGSDSPADGTGSSPATRSR